MKYLYHILLVMVSIVFFFWFYVFLVPPPRLYLSQNAYSELQLDTSSTISRRIMELSKLNNKEHFYYFDPEMPQQKFKSVFLSTMITIVIFVNFMIFLHWVNTISLPMLIAVFIAYITNISLWLFPGTINENIYLDIHSIRDVYYDIKSLQFLGLFFFMEILVIILGFWKFKPQKKSSHLIQLHKQPLSV